MSIKDKIAVVTGGSRGLGLGLVEALIAHGARVTVVARGAEACLGIRSERRLCEEVHLNLAYRWFCRLGLAGDVPIIPRSPRTATAASARAIFCASCSILFFA
jgi:NAD(P)-dependent dehydrogenase (short-subunit alcohol dehydrogenase family)